MAKMENIPFSADDSCLHVYFLTIVCFYRYISKMCKQYFEVNVPCIKAQGKILGHGSAWHNSDSQIYMHGAAINRLFYDKHILFCFSRNTSPNLHISFTHTFIWVSGNVVNFRIMAIEIA